MKTKGALLYKKLLYDSDNPLPWFPLCISEPSLGPQRHYNSQRWKGEKEINIDKVKWESTLLIRLIQSKAR